MSACTTVACGAKLSSLPVTRSSKRAPSDTTRSAFCREATAGTVPCIPGMPRCCGWLSGNAPRAIRVVTTAAGTWRGHQHGAGAAVARDVEGLCNRGTDVDRVLDQHVVLGDGRRDPH